MSSSTATAETKSDLKADDTITSVIDKGLLTWTANYILVQEGDSKNCALVHGTFKGYDADKKQFSFTGEKGKDTTFAMNGAKVRLNKQDSKVEDLKIGDNIVAIVETTGDKDSLKCLMVDRK